MKLPVAYAFDCYAFCLMLIVGSILLGYVSMVQGEQLNDSDVCRIFSQISSALLYIHQRDLLHCAITSHAIQLTSTACAKLSNFEYAMHIDRSASRNYGFGSLFT